MATNQGVENALHIVTLYHFKDKKIPNSDQIERAVIEQLAKEDDFLPFRF